jgi:hypothetical protein
VNRRPSVALLTALGAVGCVPTIDAPAGERPRATQSLVERLAVEAEGVDRLLSFQSLLSFLVLIALALVVQRGVTLVVRLAWRLGVDADRRLAWWDSAIRVLLAGVVFYFVAHRAATAAPILFAVTFIVLVAVGSTVLAGQLRNAWIGLGLALRGRLRAGDRIQLTDHEGIVREVGWMQTTLRKADGSTVIVPNRLLDENVVTVAREKNSVPVTVRVSVGAIGRLELERARRIGLLSPYRAPGSAVEVTREAVEPPMISLRVQIWAERAAREAAGHLEASLKSALESKDESRA